MKRGMIISVLLHLGLVALLFVGFSEYFTTPESSHPEPEIIESYSVDASTLENDLTKAKPTPKVIDRKLVEQEKKKVEQVKAQEEIKKEQKIKAAQERKIQAKISLQKKLKKERDAKLEKLERKKKKETLEKKKLAEKQKKEQTLKKQEALKKEQELKKQKLLKEVQRAKQAKLAEEQRASARRKAALEEGQAQERSLTNSIIGKYSALIQKKMERNWRRPADTRHLVCTTKIKLLPDGSVLDVKIVKSSGSSTFDGSVIDALYSAGTFPLPQEPKYRALFTDDDLMMKFTNKR